MAAGTQRLSAEGPLGVGKDTVCVPELKGAACAKSHLSPSLKHIGSIGVRFPLPCTVAQFPLIDWEVVDFYSWLHS